MPNLRKYFIVEDQCASAAGNAKWLDLWVDGRAGTEAQANAAMDAITGNWTVIRNPSSNLAVVAGSIAPNPRQFGNAIVTV